MELDEGRSSVRIDEPERVHAEAFHHAERARNGAIGHRPHQHVHALGHQRHEIPERVVGRCRLRVAAIGLHLHRVDQVGKLDRVLDEEHRDVVAHEIEVAFLRVELHGKAAHVARHVARARAAGDGGKAHEHRRLLLRILQERGPRQLRQRLVRLKEAVRARAARMDDPLGNPLVIEVRDLLAEDEVFEQRRPACARAQRVLIVRNRQALIGRQGLRRRCRRLMCLAAGASPGGGLVHAFLCRHVSRPLSLSQPLRQTAIIGSVAAPLSSTAAAIDRRIGFRHCVYEMASEGWTATGSFQALRRGGDEVEGPDDP